MTISWRRGIFRLWLLMSVIWCAAIWIILLQYRNIDWSLSSDRLVHVKFSNTETWDYPPDWGEDRIGADLEKRIETKNREVRDWLATVPEDQRAACSAKPSDRFANAQADIEKALKAGIPDSECEKIFWATAGTLVVPIDWKDQLRNVPLSLRQATPLLAEWAFGPPLLLLGLGIAVSWVLAGFRINV